MNKFFTYDRKEVDFFQHCSEQRAKFGKDLYIFIGTDSTSVGGKIHYFTVVAFRHSQEGVHFIFSKERVPTFRKGNGKPDLYLKLHKEFELTMEVGRALIDSKIFTKDDLVMEFDYNGLIKTVSTQLISVAKGWCQQEGFMNVLSKCNSDPRDKLHREYIVLEFAGQLVDIDQQIAVKAANHLCQGVT